MKKKWIALLLTATMVFTLAACGSKTQTPSAESQAPAETQAAEEESAAETTAPESEAVDEEADTPMAELNKQADIDVAAHEAESDEIYDEVFGEYETAYDEALAETNVSLRLAKMAIAEAKFLEAGAVTPYVNDAGNYAISKIISYRSRCGMGL